MAHPSLPIAGFRAEILEKVRHNPAVIITGGTGCGKSSQVPQFILDEILKLNNPKQIVVTQPRKIASMSVARFVAEQRGEPFPERKIRQNRKQSRVGYSVKYYYHPPKPTGSILFCTTGSVLAMLKKDPLLSNISHIILDEVHERDLFTDILVGVMKHVISKRSDFRVIVMSATLNVSSFAAFFDNCPIINIPVDKKRWFKVQNLYLEDFLPAIYADDVVEDEAAKQLVLEEHQDYVQAYGAELASQILDIELQDDVGDKLLGCIARLVKKLHEETEIESGAILVFLPGLQEISHLWDALNPNGENNLLCLGDDAELVALHSRLDMKAQALVFRPPKSGKRKVVLSTNLAETSVTIEDVRFVINCGRINIPQYDPNEKATNLNTEWITKSNQRQRAGRAGRVQDGECWNFFSRKKEASFQDHFDPEIMRLRLESVVLTIKTLGLGYFTYAREFLTSLMDPPSEVNIQDAVELLVAIEAINNVENEQVTRLGLTLAAFPLHPQLAKILLYGVLFKCVDPIMSIVSILNDKDPFTLRFRGKDGLDEVRKRFAGRDQSDHIMFANMMREFERFFKQRDSGATNHWCAQNCLNQTLLEDQYKAKLDLTRRLKSLKLAMDAQSNSCNVYARHTEVLRGALAAGLFPNLLLVSSRKSIEAPKSKSRPIGVNNNSTNSVITELRSLGKEVRYVSSRSVLSGNEKFLPADGYLSFFNARIFKKGGTHVNECSFIPEITAKVFTPQGRTIRAGKIPGFNDEILVMLLEMMKNGGASVETKFPDNVQKIARFILNPYETVDEYRRS